MTGNCKKHNIILGLLLVIFVLMYGIPVTAVNSSEVVEKLKQIQQKYPDGSFFSVDGQACTHAHNLTCSNCQLLQIYPDLKGKVSDAWTCCAFARYIYYELFHINSYSITSNSKEVALADAKVGDLVMFYSGSSITHYAIFLHFDSINGKYYMYESNYTVPNKVRYNGAFTAVQLANVKVWRANNYDTSVSTDGNANGSEGSMTTPTTSQTMLPIITPLPTATPMLTQQPVQTSLLPSTPVIALQPTSTPPSTPTPTPQPQQVPESKPDQNTTPIQPPKPIAGSVPSPKPAIDGVTSMSKNANIPVKSIRINKTQLEVRKGRTIQLNAKISPKEASNKKIIWRSKNQQIATVNADGLLKGINKGSTYVYTISVEGRKESRCMVSVN